MENIYLPLHIVTWDGNEKPHEVPGRRADAA